MLSLNLKNLTRTIRWLLLISIGVFITLLVISILGGAVPIGKWTLNPNFLQGSPTILDFSSPQNSVSRLVVELLRAPQPPAVLYSTEWHALPIKTGLWMAAGAIILLGVPLFWLGRTLQDTSEEIFP